MEKTAAETNFSETIAKVRRLSGMIAHGQKIAKQTLDTKSVWYWARHEMPALQETITSVQDIADTAESAVGSATFSVLEMQQGVQLDKFLTDMKVALDKGITVIDKPMRELIAMHNARLRQIAPAKKAIARAKKAKA